MNLTSARRILVVTKFRYLGDTIVATPFFRRVSEAAPHAEITLLSGPAMPALLRGCPYLSLILPFNPKGPKRLSRNLALIRQIRTARFDAAFLLNRSLHTALVARAARIPTRVGFDTEHRGPLLTTRVPYDWEKPDRDCALDLLRAVGVPAEPALPELWIGESERTEARHLLRRHGADSGGFLVGMQPGAHDPLVREWGAEKFAEVADSLVRVHGARIVLLGAGEERPVSDEVARRMAATPIVLAGETSLRQALAIISMCGLWVGNDGGLLHAAVALGPSTVGIFGPTKADRWGYNEPRHRTIVRPLEGGSKDSMAIRASLDSIQPEEVLAAIEAVLAETLPAGGPP